MQKIFIMHNEKELSSIVRYMKEHMQRGSAVLLRGNLGSGKTTLVRYFAGSMGMDYASSPSFNIVHTYDNGTMRITHADLYRLESGYALEELNLYEHIEQSEYTFIEWPIEGMEKMLSHYPLVLIDMFTDGIMHRAEVNL